MAADMAVDFVGTGVATVSIWMSVAQHAETPEFTGYLIDALYRDPELKEPSGQTGIGAELAERYGIPTRAAVARRHTGR
jgi:hypothetical protein